MSDCCYFSKVELIHVHGSMSCGCGVILRDNVEEIEIVMTMSTLQEIDNP